MPREGGNRARQGTAGCRVAGDRCTCRANLHQFSNDSSGVGPRQPDTSVERRDAGLAVVASGEEEEKCTPLLYRRRGCIFEIAISTGHELRAHSVFPKMAGGVTKSDLDFCTFEAAPAVVDGR